jgi:BirA family transcriptional regulator, biotin operon repressor / biotin---[acetyl-CoA-carboxylase] ligase
LPPINASNHRFIELLTVDSTNNYAMGLVHAGMAQHGDIVFAHEQTNGKGQRQKRWVANPRENIMLSLIVEPFNLNIQQQFLLSMSSAIGVQQFFSKYAGDETKIKWPNDLYWRDRKAGGILIENVIKGKDWTYAIIGVGININQSGFENVSNRAVSLKHITGNDYDLRTLAKELVDSLDESFRDLVKQPGDILHNYERVLFKRNEKVRLKKATRVFETTIRGVRQDGLLVTGDEVEELFTFGEVEWII